MSISPNSRLGPSPQPPILDRFIGIDASKARDRLATLQPRLIAMEARGGYEAIIAAALADAGLPVSIVNPRQVRKFAGAIGRLAKTDAIDAGVIAHFAEAIRPTPKANAR